jgi:alpha-amylase
LAAIFSLLAQKMGGTLPSDFLTWLEVLLGGEKGLLACDDNPYNYYTYLNDALRRQGLSSMDVDKIKIWSADFPKEHPACGRWILPPHRFTIQYDDHDQQSPGSSSRDMADKGSVLVKEKDIGKHRRFNVELFTRTDADWKIRMVFSSYSFTLNGESKGMPDGGSDCSKYRGAQDVRRCKGMTYRPAYVAEACGYSVVDEQGRWIEGEYTRTHRDLSVIQAMRRWMRLPALDVNQLGLSAKCR